MNDIIKDLREIRILRGRREWKPFMKKYGIRSVCEIGIFEARNFRRFLDGKPKIAVGIDPFNGEGRMEWLYNHFMQWVKLRSAVRLYRESSHKAVVNFPDDYFNLIYVDGDHTYEGCYQDIIDYWPKLKIGGIMVGDDFSEDTINGIRYGVINAVKKFCKDNKLKFYTLPENGWAIIK